MDLSYTFATWSNFAGNNFALITLIAPIAFAGDMFPKAMLPRSKKKSLSTNEGVRFCKSNRTIGKTDHRLPLYAGTFQFTFDNKGEVWDIDGVTVRRLAHVFGQTPTSSLRSTSSTRHLSNLQWVFWAFIRRGKITGNLATCVTWLGVVAKQGHIMCPTHRFDQWSPSWCHPSPGMDQV